MEERLAEEYMHLQKTVEEFDGKALTIKAWSVTLSATGLVAAYVEKQSVVLLIAAGSAVIFWMIEALWKTNQNAFYSRIHKIEEACRNQAKDFPVFQIASGWSQSWHAGRRERKVFQVMAWPHVFLPHLVVAVSGIALYIWLPPS